MNAARRFAMTKPTHSDWVPPKEVARDEVIARSDAVLAKPDIALTETEDVFRVRALGLDWDMGVMLYAPRDAGKIATGADGRKVGVFILHGGSGDYKSMEIVSRAFAGKFGCKVMSMTFPGRFYFDNPSHDWPGDTIHEDGTVRTPIWKKGEYITPDQYEAIRDTSMRMRYGTRTLARAKPGSLFYDRMAAWPIAFEEGMKDAMRRHFPQSEFSIYVTGHSTGGPITNMISQRVANIAGIIAIESSPFGFIQEQQHNWSGALGKIAGFERVTKKAQPRKDPFNELYIRTWRDRARYAGPEALGQEGPNALMRLPWLMEEILDWWDKTKARPQFKAEYVITHNIAASLEAAARAAASRLKMDAQETEALVAHYLGLPYPLKGPGVKPAPPVLAVITKDSRDHSPEVYTEVVAPLYATIDPPPRFNFCRLGAGVHTYHKSEDGLPLGVVPTAAQIQFEAITNGYFLA
jgi:hypothetical protein